MAKEKKELTVVQTKNKYRAFQYLSFGGEFVSILSPYIALGIVNFDEWFTNNPDSWKVGLGGSLALALLGIAIFLFSKKEENEKITNGYVAFVIGWFAVAFVFMLLASIMDQIATIMFFGGLGLLGAFGLKLVSNNYKEKADTLQEIINKVNNEEVEAKVRHDIEEQARREVKVKIKIKK